MDFERLTEMSYVDLKTVAEKMGIKPPRNKTDLVREIRKGFKEYEEYKHRKIDPYTWGEQIGNKGKEGITYAVTDREGHKLAVKTFKKTKSSEALRREARLQKLAADVGAAPNVVATDVINKRIYMQRLDRHLVDVIQEQGGHLSETHQRRIVTILRKIDDAGVFHADSNITNWMLSTRGKIYLIDYGMAKDINPALIKKVGTSTPNLDYGTATLVIQLRKVGAPDSSYSLLRRHIPEDQQRKLGL